MFRIVTNVTQSKNGEAWKPERNKRREGKKEKATT